MFYLGFNIRNPLPKEKPHQRLIDLDKKISKNKNFQLELYTRGTYRLFGFSLDLDWFGRDHAGPEFDIEIFGLSFHIGIYDGRHWDDENNRWETQNNA